MNDQKPTYLPINQWAEEERPREKLLSKGISSLTNAELLAILIRSGSRQNSAVDVSMQLLEIANQKLHLLSRMNLKEIMSVKGIGEAKAMCIIAALELGRRRKSEEGDQIPTVKSSQDAYQMIASKIEDLTHEEFWILLLNRQNALIKKIKISEGGVSGTVVDSKIIFKHAIENLSSSIILAHNHPSGNLSPSEQDKNITQKIKKAGAFMDIGLLDHLIITSSGYYSFADEGVL